jgi:predicted RNA-binding Zn-ribbon protein involved in translation (DUF1610 family)
MAYVLYDQQNLFVDAIRDAYVRGARRVCGVGATGFGKGVVSGDMAFKSAGKGRDVLVITNRRQIVLQLQEHCYNAGVPAGIIMGNIEPDMSARVQVASAQTLQRRGFSGIPKPGFILIDECHQYFQFYQKLIREVYPDVRVLGMTATPVGPGGAKLSHFDAIVEPIKNSEVIAAGRLLRVHPYLAPSEPDMGGINLKVASQDEIGQRVEVCTVYGDVFAEWEPFKHMQTMVVLPSRAVCNGFLRQCLARGISAKVVDGTTDTDERKETFSEFKAGDCQMLLGVDVIREGLDLPVAQCLIDLQPTHQFRVYWQKIGRIKRPHPGQESAVVIDLAGNLWRHMVHPDQDPPWDEVTNDMTIEEIIERKAGVRCPKCGSKDIYSIKGHGYKCEACGHDWNPTKPFVCPSCKQGLAPYQKVINGICPNCGKKISVKPVRRIRMQDGTIRVVPSHEIKRRKKCKANCEQATWDKYRCIANNCGRTLDFARVMYHREMGKWPSGLKNCPDSPNSGDWKRRPADVYPWMRKKQPQGDQPCKPA